MPTRRVPPTRQAREARKAEAKRIVEKAKAEVQMRILRLATICPNGKALKFALGSELTLWGDAYRRIAVIVPPTKMVGQVILGDDDLFELLKHAG